MAKGSNVMSSVDRALSLFQYFSIERPEIGLSDLSRAAELDKTTTLRCLNALERNGFLEQHPDTKKYRIGIAALHLARMREESFPVQTLIQPVLDRISQDLRETAHASLISNRTLVTVAVSEPARGARAVVDRTAPLPFHATASGIAVLAHMGARARAEIDTGTEMDAFTASTATTRDALDAAIAQARADGFARAAGTYEDDVIGTAVPIYGWHNKVVGALAVASVAARYDAALGARIERTLFAASREISRRLGS